MNTEFKLVIPDSVKEIEYRVFEGSGIREVRFSEDAESDYGVLIIPQSVEKTGEGVFSSCKNLQLVEWNRIEVIANFTFHSCKKLASVSFGEGLHSIGYQAFAECDSLESIKIPQSVTEGERYFSEYGGWFAGCDKLKDIELGEGTPKIVKGSFARLNTEFKLVILDTVKTIEKHAFMDCTGLKELRLPDKLESIGEEAFRGCNNLVLKLSMNPGVLAYIFDNKLKYELKSGNMVLNPKILNESGSRYEIIEKLQDGKLRVNIRYEIKPEEMTNITEVSLRIRIPDTAEFTGENITGVDKDKVISRNNIVSIPVEEASGNLEFELERERYGNILSFASINYTKDGRRYDDFVGYINEEAGLSIEIPEITGSDFNIRGVAAPDSTVRISRDDEILGEAKADTYGRYEYEVKESGEENRVYRYTVQSAGTEGMTDKGSASKESVYQASTSTIKEWSIDYINRNQTTTYNMLDTTTREQHLHLGQGRNVVYRMKISND